MPVQYFENNVLAFRSFTRTCKRKGLSRLNDSIHINQNRYSNNTNEEEEDDEEDEDDDDDDDDKNTLPRMPTQQRAIDQKYNNNIIMSVRVSQRLHEQAANISLLQRFVTHSTEAKNSPRGYRLLLTRYTCFLLVRRIPDDTRGPREPRCVSLSQAKLGKLATSRVLLVLCLAPLAKPWLPRVHETHVWLWLDGWMDNAS